MTEGVAAVGHYHDEAPRLSLDWFALAPVVYFDATGEIDACVADIVRTALAAALERPCVRQIVVDLGSLWFLDAGGARALIDAHRSAEQRNVWLHVVGAHGTPRLVLEILDVYELLRAPERRQHGGNLTRSASTCAPQGQGLQMGLWHLDRTE